MPDLAIVRDSKKIMIILLGEISDQLKSWEMLTSRCDHPELAKFICSLYTPVCLQNSQGTPEDMKPYMVPPCKQLCQSVYDKCYTVCNKYYVIAKMTSSLRYFSTSNKQRYLGHKT